MKILLLSNTNNRENGYGNLTHNFCLFLKERGIDFTLLLPKDEQRFEYTNYPVEYVLPPYIFDLKTPKILEYAAFSYTTDADVIHSITEFPYAILAARIAKKNKKPLIIESAGTYGVKPLLYPFQKQLLTWAYNQANLIVPISDYTGKMIRQLSGTKTEMKIIHPGVDFKRFDVPVSVDDIRSAYNNKKILLTVGVLKPRKGHDVILKALGELKKERDNFHYLIIGADNEGRDVYYESLMNLIAENGLEKNVTFLRNIKGNEVVRYFHAADVYVHTPRVIHMNYEGFGIVYLEAGACHKPVIGADSGGVPDAIIPNKTGILVPENDPSAVAAALRKILDNPELAQNMGEAGYAYAQEHTWEKIGEKYLEVYKKLSN